MLNGAVDITKHGWMGNRVPSSAWKANSQSTSFPRFGSLPLDAVDETAVQEFVAGLKRATFKLTKRNGSLIKTYKLSRKTILNVVGVVKLVLGKKIWMTWELDFGEAGSPRATLFHRTTVEKDYPISRRPILCSLCIVGRNRNATGRGSRTAYRRS